MDPTEEIRALLDALGAAWTRGDADAVGALFTEDCDHVGHDGSHLIGRGSNVATHRDLLSGVLEGTRRVAEVGRVRFVTPEVAIVVASGAVLWPWQAHPTRGRLSRQTLVVIRGPSGWRIAALHDTRIRPVAAAGPRILALVRLWVRIRRAIPG